MDPSRSSHHLALPLSLLVTLGGVFTGCAGEPGTAPDEDVIDVTRALTLPADDAVVAAYDDLTVNVPGRFNIPYAGMAAAEFPDGLPLSVGSALRFRRQGPGLSFYGLTDRGPNVDAPNFLDAAGVSHPTKAFLLPDFTPRILTISVFPFFGPVVTAAVPIKSAGVPVNGLALGPPEVSLTEELTPLPASTVGLDPEGIDIDSHGNLWLCDESSPSIAKVNPRTGEILTKLTPGAGLPAILANRQINRGFEGLAVGASGKVYGMIQSTLDIAGATKAKAQFLRLVEYDPTTGATRMFAYPHDIAQYAKSQDAKMGDLAAIDDGRFLVIEQGKNSAGNPRNLVYAIDIAGATDLTGVTLTSGPNAGKDLEYGTAVEVAAQITMIRKALVVDLRAYGWTDEKAEGLSLVDNKTLVVANDQDFGTSSKMTGDPQSTDPTKYAVDAAGTLTFNGVVSPATFEIHAADPSTWRSHLLVVRLKQPVSAYAPL
jgi:hypothetical protein